MSKHTQKWKLFEVGRAKFTGEVEVDDLNGLYREIAKHLSSRDVDIDWHDETSGIVIVGGFRAVGAVMRISA
jgi:hypothetical protein